MDPERAEQQRRLVEELKSAQNILRRRRAADGEQEDRIPQVESTTPPPTTHNGIHIDKPRVLTADALWSKKPRSERDAAAFDSKKVYLDAFVIVLARFSLMPRI